MQSRVFGRTGRPVSEIGFGAWAIGGSWGHVEAADAKVALHVALDAGVTASIRPTLTAIGALNN